MTLTVISGLLTLLALNWQWVVGAVVFETTTAIGELYYQCEEPMELGSEVLSSYEYWMETPLGPKMDLGQKQESREGLKCVPARFVLRKNRWCELCEILEIRCQETGLLLAYEVCDFGSDSFSEATVWWPDGRVREQKHYYNGEQTGRDHRDSGWWWGIEDSMKTVPRQRWGVTRDKID